MGQLMGTDVPRPLTNDLWVFLSQTINTEYVKLASPAGTYVYVKAVTVNVNKRLKPFFLEQHINIVNSHASMLLVYLYLLYIYCSQSRGYLDNKNYTTYQANVMYLKQLVLAKSSYQQYE